MWNTSSPFSTIEHQRKIRVKIRDWQSLTYGLDTSIFMWLILFWNKHALWDNLPPDIPKTARQQQHICYKVKDYARGEVNIPYFTSNTIVAADDFSLSGGEAFMIKFIHHYFVGIETA